MKQLTINGTTWGFVEVPEGHDSVWIGTFSNYLYHSPNRINLIPSCMPLPPGHWSDPIKASEVTEEQAKGMVEGIQEYKGIWIYKCYQTGKALHTATESLYSLIRSLGMEPNRTVILKQVK